MGTEFTPKLPAAHVPAALPSREEAAATARTEWTANADGCRSAFVSEAAYVGYRSNQLRGRVVRPAR